MVAGLPGDGEQADGLPVDVVAGPLAHVSPLAGRQLEIARRGLVGEVWYAAGGLLEHAGVGAIAFERLRHGEGRSTGRECGGIEAIEEERVEDLEDNVHGGRVVRRAGGEVEEGVGGGRGRGWRVFGRSSYTITWMKSEDETKREKKRGSVLSANDTAGARLRREAAAWSNYFLEAVGRPRLLRVSALPPRHLNMPSTASPVSPASPIITALRRSSFALVTAVVWTDECHAIDSERLFAGPSACAFALLGLVSSHQSRSWHYPPSSTISLSRPMMLGHLRRVGLAQQS